MRILIVLTSHDQLGTSGEKTGFWLEEFTAPYYVFKDAGAEVVIASPKGGRPPIDPRSEHPESLGETTSRFKADVVAETDLDHTVALAKVDVADFDAVFYAGGHGPLWDLAEDGDSVALIEAFNAAGKPVSAVCHGPAVLRHVKSGGVPLVKGRNVTGFSNAEEMGVKLDKIVPFLLEDELKRLGGVYAKGPDFGSFIQVDRNLVTGQNPASSTAVARALMGLLNIRGAKAIQPQTVEA
jgi:putative intracellular protease/amidase